MPLKIIIAAAMLLGATAVGGSAAIGPQEAPSGFDNATNGYVMPAEFDAARTKF